MAPVHAPGNDLISYNFFVLIQIQPCVWKPPWFDQEVWSHVLQTVLPQQRQGDWLHQDQSSLIGTHTPLKSREMS
ncbi:hypothetical protein G4B88_011311 [Cannabis sativa]|uniref:Uncharacterized protein n=1 Tax=Cannabis sativa TaxID=3483 RepID=A0A7J6GJL8_CANSA|nr:hypothetical protein G4B88_011311 [Cannabis sativa]